MTLAAQRPMRIITLLARHGTNQYAHAHLTIDTLFAQQMPHIAHDLVISDNTLPDDYQERLPQRRVLIGSSNKHWEFSAWDRAIEFVGRHIEDYDLVHLATSAFRALDVRHLDRFDARMLAWALGRRVAIGHLEAFPQPAVLTGHRSQEFLRSSWILLPPQELKLLGSVTSIEDSTPFFSGRPEAPFRVDAPLSRDCQEYILDRLTGAGRGQGGMWHSRFQLSAETLAYFEGKTVAMLNEQMLSIRLRSQGCMIVDATWLSARLAQLPGRPIAAIPSWRWQLTARDLVLHHEAHGSKAWQSVLWRAVLRRPWLLTCRPVLRALRRVFGIEPTSAPPSGRVARILKSITVSSLNRRFRRRVSRLVRTAIRRFRADTRDGAMPVIIGEPAKLNPSVPLRVVVTLDEVNDQHGTGPLVRRICAGWSNVVSIRSRNDYDGIQDFGEWQVTLGQQARTRSDFFDIVSRLLRDRCVETILCVPFELGDVLTGIAVQECSGARLCTYVMDEQDCGGDSVPVDQMRELLERSSLRLATHPEIRFACESRFQLPFHVLPPVAPAALIATRPIPFKPAGTDHRAALLGSFWDQEWFDMLCAALAGSGWEVDWFGNNRSQWFTFPPQQLARARIQPLGVIPERDLVAQLRRYPFVIVPVGQLTATEKNHGVARLSLPSRILFALATSNTPILIVGSPRTCGARFVTHFGVGDVCPYDAPKLAAAMNQISTQSSQMRIRYQAARIASTLSDHDVPAWLDASIRQGKPMDNRFEVLFSGYDSRIELNNSRSSTV